MQKMGSYIKPKLNNNERQYRQYPEDRHHILARSRGGSNDSINIAKRDQRLHVAFHKVFGNGTIDEQIIQLLNFNGQALSEEFSRDVMRILEETDQEYYYKNGVLLPRAEFERKQRRKKKYKKQNRGIGQSG